MQEVTNQMEKQNKKLDGKKYSFEQNDRQLLEDIKKGKNVNIEHTHQTDISSKQVASAITGNIEKAFMNKLDEKINTKELDDKLNQLNELRQKELDEVEKKAKYYKKITLGLLLLCVILVIITTFAGGLFDFIGLDKLQSYMLYEMKHVQGFYKVFAFLGYITLPLIWFGLFSWLCVYLYRKID
jgi:hypothetical protein